MTSNKFFIVLLFLLTTFSCTQETTKPKNKTIQTLPVIDLVACDTVMKKQYVSDINAVKNVEIRARVEGFLEKIYVDEGQTVKKGQALFRINSEEYQAELAKAEANLKSAIATAKASKLELNRIELLVEKGVISSSELDVAKAKLAASSARIEEARSAQSNAAIRLSYTYLKSPFDGIIDRIPLKVGSLINQGTLLTTVSDNRNVYAYFNVSESEYLNYIRMLNKGNENSNTVNLIRADGTMHPYTGQIETMEGQFDTRTGTIAFRAKFPNPAGVLKHGSSGKVILTNALRNALMLPQKATFDVQDKTYVFKLMPDNTVKVTPFIPLMRFSDFYIVKSGLKEGDRIVYEGIQELRDGYTISPKYLSLDSLLNGVEKGKVIF